MPDANIQTATTVAPITYVVSLDDTANTYVGKPVNEFVRGFNGNDTINGNGGDDIISGDAGNDSLTGGDGDDIIMSGSGMDNVYGNAGNDYLGAQTGVNEISRLNGNEGNDTLVGEGVGTVFERAGKGDDTIMMRAATNVAYGGLGKDNFVVSAGKDNIIMDYAAGDYVTGLDMKAATYSVKYDTATNFSVATDGKATVFLLGDVRATLTSNPNVTPVEDPIEKLRATAVKGTVNDDAKILDKNNNAYDGLAGNDGIDGKEGNDLLFGGAGNDTIADGLGQDSVYGDAGDDMLAFSKDGNVDVMTGGAGKDTFKFAYGSDGIPVPAAGVKEIDTIADFDKANDIILISDARMPLPAGNVALTKALLVTNKTIEQSGKDVVFHDIGRDVLIKNTTLADLTDANFKFGNSTTPVNPVEALRAAAVKGTANADTAALDAKDNNYDGGLGNDNITGNAGNDTLFGGAGNDTMLGGEGNDKIYTDAGNDILRGGNGNDWLDSYGSLVGNIIMMLGDAGNDTIRTGGEGTVYAAGGVGDDKFFIHGKNALFIGGAGIDSYSVGNDSGRTVILDFTAEDKVQTTDMAKTTKHFDAGQNATYVFADNDSIAKIMGNHTANLTYIKDAVPADVTTLLF